MFRSLRFRLPALSLAGILLAGLITTAIAVRLFQIHTRNQSLAELRQEATGLTRLYAEAALEAQKEGRKTPLFNERELEAATGDRLFYVGAPVFFGQEPGLRPLAQDLLDFAAILRGEVVEFEFRLPGGKRTFIAVANPMFLEGAGPPLGALVVATPKTELTDELLTLLGLLGVSFLGGVAVAGALAVYLSRRIVRPVLGLASAADEVAQGNYDVAVPTVKGGGEIGELADSFRDMARRLAEAERLERNFLMSVSHELRTPLTAIRGHVDALLEGLAGDPEARQASLEVIAAESNRLSRLVGDVLDLAKLDARRFTLLQEEVDMERLLEQAYSAFAEEARRRGIDYRRDIGARPVILTDGDRVLQIISNLLSNAFRWTPDGGRVELSLTAENGDVAVAVGDTGPGIDAADRERIFRPFWSSDGAGGTGLGLAIARELAFALGGRLDVESAPGAGSRFELVLPNETAAEPAP